MNCVFELRRYGPTSARCRIRLFHPGVRARDISRWPGTLATDPGGLS